MNKFSLRIITSLITASFVLPAAAAAAETASYPADDEFVTFIVETDFSPAAEYTALKNSGIALFADIDEEEIAQNVTEQNSEILSAAAEELGSDTSESFVYSQLFSGFTITARRGDIDKLLSLDGVVNVSEDGLLYVIEDEPADGDDVMEIQTNTAYRGRGTAIAIIDSGFELSHPYLNADIESPKYSQENIETAISGTLSGRGKYYSEKIPFTYDYYENSSEDSAIGNNNEHGTHVAGIAAGKNGIIANGDTINGAAPDAQLVLMACSNASGGVPFSSIMAALNDAAALNVDAINMSIGLAYVDVRLSDYANGVLKSVAAARSAGIPVCVSSGNEARGFYSSTPLVTNPDYSAEGMFAKDTNTFSVASANIPSYYMNLSKLVLGDGSEVPGLNVSEDNIADFSSKFTSATEYVDCGIGLAADFTGKDLTGKIALIQRGAATFEAKTTNAKNAGAVGAIIYNTDNEYINISGCKLPTMVVTSETGEKLAACTKKTVYVSGTMVDTAQSSTGNQPSSFTSWGVTETLELTPNITAYGGNIYSAAPGGSYQILSGTSMSSPYIAGTSACVKEYLNTKPFGELTGINTADLIQQLLMSTAEPLRNPITDEEQSLGLPYSPRQQGAGLANLDKAVTTPVVLYNNDGKTLVNLGDDIDNTFTLAFTVSNFSDSDITFDNVSLEMISDGALKASEEAVEIFVYGTSPVKVDSYTDNAVTVKANDTSEVSVTVTLNNTQLANYAAVFTNGFYLDGFIRLSNSEYSVGLPFMCFRGDWGAVPMWDSTVYDEAGSTLYAVYGGKTYDYKTYISTKIDDKSVQLNKGYFILSPNGDGKADTISATFGLYRASNSIHLDILQDDKSVVTETKSGRYSKFSTQTLDLARDLSGLEDGEYTFRLTGYADNGNGGTAPQTLDFPIIIDKTAPTVTKTLSEDGSTLTVKAADTNYLRSVTVSYTDTDGNTQTESATLDNMQTSYEKAFTLTNANPATITVIAEDYAYNTAVSYDLTIPIKNTDGSTATAFKSVITNNQEEQKSFTGAHGIVTNSSGETRIFDGSFNQTITIATDASCIIGIIVEGLCDPGASIQLELN
ncbi:MAG: S8 family serine peptidase [Candidatus Ornithomonoglobus sp.]